MNVLLELQSELFSKLSSSLELASMLDGSKVFDRVPDGIKPPYITFGKMVHLDWSTDAQDGLEHDIELEIWSAEKGRKQIVLLAGAILKELKTLPNVLSDHALVNWQFQSLESDFDNESQLFKGKLSYRAVTEPLTT